MAQRLVVGWDGSQGAAGALEWAVRQAPNPERIEILEVEFSGRRRGSPHRDPEEAAAALRRAHPDLDVVVSAEQGDVVRVLAARSGPDVLVVLGGRENAELRVGQRGGVAYRVVVAAEGPVVVVPQSYQGGRDVVVGVVRRSDSRTVVLAAAAEAARRHQRLIAVHAWRRLLDLDTFFDIDPADRAYAGKVHERMMQEVLAPVSEAYPDLVVLRHVVHGRASDVLVEESRHAALLVLGKDSPAAAEKGQPVTHSGMLLSRAPVLVVPQGTPVPEPAKL
jgi:hypothetical protein